MKRKLKILFVLIAFSFIAAGIQAQVDADKLLKSVGTRLSKINGYTVDLLIKVEVDMVKINDRKAKLTYQKPNKFKFDSEGFLLLPKTGMEMDYMKLIEKQANAIYIKDEFVNNVSTHLIKVIPVDPASDVVLAEMWVDPKKAVVMRMKTYTKESGSYLVNFYYTNHPYNLPDRMIVEFDVKGSKIPQKIAGGEFNSKEKELLFKDSKGKVIVIYSNYKVTTTPK